MANLEIRSLTGDVENRELTKTQPVSIGRHSSNDICIDEDGVAIMHCRIAWNKNGYELTAAGQDGVEVNGTPVQRAMLKNGDMIRIGTVDIAVTLDGVAPAVKPLPDDLFEDDIPEAKPAKPSKTAKPFPVQPIMEAEPVLEAEPILEAEPVMDAEPVLEAEPVGAEEYEAPRATQVDAPDDRRHSISERLRRRMDSMGSRPGEQPILRSKFLIGIVVGICVLSLIAGVLWFWTLLNAADVLYEETVALHEEGKYDQAIKGYTDFLDRFPRDSRVTEVKFRRGRAEIEKYVAGSASSWAEGLKAIEKFENDNRTLEGFNEQEENLKKYAQDIALGACRTALRTKKREYLPVAIDARKRASGGGSANAEFELDFTKRYREAKEAVDRNETFVGMQTAIKAALTKPDIFAAIDHRLKFLQSYPTPLPDERQSLSSLLKQTMEKEKSLIAAADLNRKAATKDRPERLGKVLSLTAHFAPKDGRKSDNAQIVIGVARHCVYGIDAISGEPVWRRAIGYDTPFFPMSVEVSQPSLLVFDTEFHELLLLQRKTGALIWRQPFVDANDPPESLSGPPLVHEGQIYLPTRNRRLYQVDLGTGVVRKQLTFSQELHAPPVIAPDNARIVVAGDNALLYTVTIKPELSCESVTYLGHKPGSLKAPMIRIGKLVLTCENDRQDSARLRVLNTSQRGRWLSELTFDDKPIRVPGNIYDQPALRHNQLFVTSTGERVSVFTVSDDTELPETERNEFQFLRPGPVFQEKSTHSGPIYLTAGPNGQFWMASNRLRLFELKTGRIQEDPRETAFGRATQPPQVIGQQIYLGRQADFSSSVSITQHDREQMDDGQWRAVLGAKILAWSQTGGNPIVAVSEDGYAFTVSPDELARGGFKIDTKFGLLPPKYALNRPLHALALPDGKIIVTAGGKDPGMWVVDSFGRNERKVPIPNDVETNPIAIGDGVVLPLPGRLRYLASKIGGGRVEDFEAPFDAAKKERPVWTFLTPVSKTEFVAADSTGRLMLIQLRSGGGRTYLGKVVDRQMPKPIGFGIAAHQGNIVIADGTEGIQVLNTATLQPIASTKTPGAVTNAVWSAGDLILVEVDRNRLLGYRLANNSLTKVWETKLRSEAGLAGSPQISGADLLVTERNGTIHRLDPAAGTSRATITLGEPLDQTPRAIGSETFVPSVDGSLHAVQSKPAVGG